MEIDLRDGKALVLYFSLGGDIANVGEAEYGNTQIVAAAIEADLGKRGIEAESFRIEPVESYPEKYDDVLSRVKDENAAESFPEYYGDVEHLADYDVVYLGYPIWFGDLPKIVEGFLAKHEFAGKVIVPFCTHEGSGESGTFAKLREKLPDADVLQDGFSIKGSEARDESIIQKVADWLDSLGL